MGETNQNRSGFDNDAKENQSITRGNTPSLFDIDAKENQSITRGNIPSLCENSVSTSLSSMFMILSSDVEDCSRYKPQMSAWLPEEAIDSRPRDCSVSSTGSCQNGGGPHETASTPFFDSLSALTAFTVQHQSQISTGQLDSSTMLSENSTVCVPTCGTKKQSWATTSGTVPLPFFLQNAELKVKSLRKGRDVTGNASQQCAVCGNTASGHYFGAVICLPCKSFYIRCTQGWKPKTLVTCDGKCDIQEVGTKRCRYCRYQKCLSAGMFRKEKPETVIPENGQFLCSVCGDIANGIHFGVISCEGCKKFFRRGLQEHHTYVCKSNQMCLINPRMRTNCRYCRYQKCLSVGMSRSAIKLGRPRKGRINKAHSSKAAITRHPSRLAEYTHLRNRYYKVHSAQGQFVDQGGDKTSPERTPMENPKTLSDKFLEDIGIEVETGAANNDLTTVGWHCPGQQPAPVVHHDLVCKATTAAALSFGKSELFSRDDSSAVEDCLSHDSVCRPTAVGIRRADILSPPASAGSVHAHLPEICAASQSQVICLEMEVEEEIKEKDGRMSSFSEPTFKSQADIRQRLPESQHLICSSLTSCIYQLYSSEGSCAELAAFGHTVNKQSLSWNEQSPSSKNGQYLSSWNEQYPSSKNGQIPSSWNEQSPSSWNELSPSSWNEQSPYSWNEQSPSSWNEQSPSSWNEQSTSSLNEQLYSSLNEQSPSWNEQSPSSKNGQSLASWNEQSLSSWNEQSTSSWNEQSTS